MAGLEAARRINGLPCTLKQRIWQLEHAEEWGEVVYTYEQVPTTAATVTSLCRLSTASTIAASSTADTAAVALSDSA
jgi:hypothetical protein